MWKYLKQLFREIIVQSKQLVGRNMQSVNNEETVNAEERLFPRESTRRPNREKSLSNNENSAKRCKIEAQTTRRRIRYSREKRNSRNKSRNKSDKVDDKSTKIEDKESLVTEQICRCDNCKIVKTLNECGVCLEMMHDRGVKSCTICANIVCSVCSEKLKVCPYCRSSQPMEKNRPIERLLNGLFLPCRNAKNGCCEMLNSDTRSKHEAACTLIDCPVSKDCRWNGATGTILNHLKNVHGFEPFEHHDLMVEISSFRRKIMRRGGEHKIHLLCYDQLFAVKITLRQKKMKLSFTRMGYTCEKSQVAHCENKSYDVWIKMNVGNRNVHAVLIFGKFNIEARRMEIDCNSLCSSSLDNNHRENDDTLKIEMSIREHQE